MQNHHLQRQLLGLVTISLPHPSCLARPDPAILMHLTWPSARCSPPLPCKPCRRSYNKSTNWRRAVGQTRAFRALLPGAGAGGAGGCGTTWMAWSPAYMRTREMGEMQGRPPAPAELGAKEATREKDGEAPQGPPNRREKLCLARERKACTARDRTDCPAHGDRHTSRTGAGQKKLDPRSA